jgi:hypothetical protein
LNGKSLPEKKDAVHDLRVGDVLSLFKVNGRDLFKYEVVLPSESVGGGVDEGGETQEIKEFVDVGGSSSNDGGGSSSSSSSSSSEESSNKAQQDQHQSKIQDEMLAHFECPLCLRLILTHTSGASCNHYFCAECLHEHADAKANAVCPICNSLLGQLKRVGQMDGILLSLVNNGGVKEEDGVEFLERSGKGGGGGSGGGVAVPAAAAAAAASPKRQRAGGGGSSSAAPVGQRQRTLIDLIRSGAGGGGKKPFNPADDIIDLT